MRKFLFSLQLFLAPAVAAQTAAQRDLIASLRSELADVADSTVLVRRESLTIEVARVERDSVMIHVELGLIAYRLGEITGEDRHYDDAAGEFEWAAELAPDWVWPHYGRARAEFALGEHAIIAIENLRQLFGIDHISDAVDALFDAVGVEPGFVPALEMLVELAPRQRFRRPITEVFDAFERAARTEAVDNPEFQVAYGRFLRDQGRYPEALEAFRQALRLAGRTPERLLELGRTQFALGIDRPGRANYYEAARTVASNSTREMLREDVAWVASPNELAQFDQLGFGEIEPFLREFWERRALIEFRRPGERVAEHFRRYYHALQNHRLFSKNRRVEINRPYRPDQDEVDDMGVVYIRHGEPLDRITFRSADGPEQYTWGYPLNESRMLLHFSPGNTLFGESAIGRDYRLVETVGSDRERAEVLRNLDPIYERLAGGLGATRSSVVATEINLMRRHIERATSTDSYAIRFDRRVDVVRDVFLFSGGAEGEGTALITLALPGDLFPYRTWPGRSGIVYPVDVRVIGIGADRMVVSLRDTVRQFAAPAPLAPGTALLAVVEVPVFAEAPALGVLVSDSARSVGTTVVTDSLRPPVSVAGSVAMSDILLGSDQLDVRWESRGVPVNPLNIFARGTVLEVYYELYGLVEGQPYDVELEVRRRRSGIGGFISGLFGGGSQVRIAFQGRSEGLTTEIRQSIDLEDLSAGEYEVSLKMRFLDGEEVERERLIVVID